MHVAPPIDPLFDEAARLAALDTLALLDTDPDAEFDALVALAAEMLGCPTAILSLIDRDRSWVKAAVGSDVTEVPRSMTVCDHTLRHDGHMIVEDLLQDQRFTDNPMVAAEGVRFYAGMQIHVVDGDGQRQPVGVLCVTDAKPRCLSRTGRAALSHIATLAEALLNARRTAMEAMKLARKSEAMAGELRRKDAIFRQAERMAMMGSWRYSPTEHRVEWSEGVYRIHGYALGQRPSLAEAIDHYPPSEQARVSAALAETIETGRRFDIEEDFFDARGQKLRIRSQGELETDEYGEVSIVGVFQDITDRHKLEIALRHSADTDALTGIANRAAFDRTMEGAMTRAAAAGTPLLLFLVDLDGFKGINDTLGHTAGDDVLRDVGAVLRADWLRGSCPARLGGDEFAVIIEDPALAADPLALAARLEDALSFPVRGDTSGAHCAGTVGFAHFTADCRSVRDLIHRADTVLYAAKRERARERRRTERVRDAA